MSALLAALLAVVIPPRGHEAPPLAHVPITPLPEVRVITGLAAIRLWLGAGGQVDSHGRIS